MGQVKSLGRRRFMCRMGMASWLRQPVYRIALDSQLFGHAIPLADLTTHPLLSIFALPLSGNADRDRTDKPDSHF